LPEKQTSLAIFPMIPAWGSMLRSRIREHCERVLVEDMLTLFSCTASLRSLECSTVLQGVAQLHNESKYRTACILQILTGQRPAAVNCIVDWEDPTHQRRSIDEQKQIDRVKGAMLHRSGQASSAADYRAIGTGVRLTCTMRRQGMWDFLEKLREFYLPDILLLRGADAPSTLASTIGIKQPSLVEYFAAWNRSKLPGSPRFVPATAVDLSACTTFLLKSSDLLRFPDIEVHFEGLGGAQTFTSNHEAHILKLFLRPTLQIKYPSGMRQYASTGLPPLNHMAVFNYVLSRVFNPYTLRPSLKQQLLRSSSKQQEAEDDSRAVSLTN